MLGEDLPVWLTMSVRAVACSRADGVRVLLQAGCAAITSAATPATWGDDIDVPWNHPERAAVQVKQAKSAGPPMVRQMSPFFTVAPELAPTSGEHVGARSGVELRHAVLPGAAWRADVHALAVAGVVGEVVQGALHAARAG